MKHLKRKLIAVIFGVTVSLQALAVGGVVTDPTSYLYYVQQIEEAQRQFEQATRHLNTAIETKDNVFNVERQLKGNYTRALRHIKNFESWRDQIKDDPLQFAEDTIKNRDAITDYSKKIERKIDSYYMGEDLFDEKGKKRSDWVNIERAKKEQQQISYKRAMIQAEKARGMVEINIQDLDQLAKEVNDTQSLKDSSDVNNSILIKLLESVQQTNSLLSDISATLAMANYGGENSVKKENFDDIFNDTKHEPKKDNSVRGYRNPWTDCNPLTGEGSGCERYRSK